MKRDVTSNQNNSVSNGLDARPAWRPTTTLHGTLHGQRGRARVENLVFVLSLVAILAAAALVA